MAGLRHPGTGHRGMSDADGGSETHRPLADLARQMARVDVAERGVAGDLRVERVPDPPMARDPAPAGRTADFAQRSIGGPGFRPAPDDGKADRTGNRESTPRRVGKKLAPDSGGSRPITPADPGRVESLCAERPS